MVWGFFVFWMSYTVYILRSVNFDRYYIGQTADISDRLQRHNNGREKYTSPYLPWYLIWSAEVESRSEAMILERKLKNLSRARLKLFIEKYSKGKAGADDSA